MRDFWPGGGHLTVQRDLDGNDNLVEVWELENLVWQGDDEAGQYDLVKHWVADVNDVPAGGVPYAGDAVSGTCEFSEVPEAVRESFIEQAKNLRDVVETLEEGVSDDGE